MRLKRKQTVDGNQEDTSEFDKTRKSRFKLAFKSIAITFPVASLAYVALKTNSWSAQILKISLINQESRSEDVRTTEIRI